MSEWTSWTAVAKGRPTLAVSGNSHVGVTWEQASSARTALDSSSANSMSSLVSALLQQLSSTLCVFEAIEKHVVGPEIRIYHRHPSPPSESSHTDGCDHHMPT